jgi:hypothetical protein
MELTITKETARRLYPEAPDWFKAELESEFGKDMFKEKSFNKIKTFEDACDAVGVEPNDVVNSNDTVDEAAYKKLKVVAKAINNGWVPDWNYSDQYKWYPWFRLSSGFGFSCADCRYVASGSYVGSRLCFETEEQAVYAGTQFKSLYKDLLTL